MRQITTPRPAPQAKFKPMSDEEKKTRIMQFLQQKREQFAINILCNLCRTLDKDASSAHAEAMVDLSVDMADKLMDKLYPLPEDADKTAE